MDRLKVAGPVAAVLLGLLIAVIASQSLLAGIVIAVVVGVVVGILLVTSLLRTTSSVEDAARAFTAGDYQVRAEDSGPREASGLVTAFNTMAQELQTRMTIASEGRSRLMAALDSSVDPVIALDAESKVVFANLAAQKLFDRDHRAIQSNPISWLLPDEQVIEAIRASGERRSQVSIGIERPGRRFFQVVTTPISGGGEWAVLVVIHDVSDVKRTEQVRRDFVANVSHELRTPLAGIKAVIETLAEGALDDREAAIDFLSRADSEVDRLIILVEELLELSRIESGEIPLAPRPTDVGNLIGDVVDRLRPVAERKHVSIDVDLSGRPGTAQVDPERMERALLNLVGNAVKFTPEDGTVTVTARREGESLVLEVRDTGIGIDVADQPRVFERFYKADQSRAGRAGSGIGLAIVKHTVEAHGGSVSVESALSRGSTFTVRLPIKG